MIMSLGETLDGEYLSTSWQMFSCVGDIKVNRVFEQCKKKIDNGISLSDLIKYVLKRFQAISKDHAEVWDTAVREAILCAIDNYWRKSRKEIIYSSFDI
jgi:hypothetical protein